MKSYQYMLKGEKYHYMRGLKICDIEVKHDKNADDLRLALDPTSFQVS